MRKHILNTLVGTLVTLTTAVAQLPQIDFL